MQAGATAEKSTAEMERICSSGCRARPATPRPPALFRRRWLTTGFVRRVLLARSRVRPSAGFSLLELLVVVAVMSVLAAVLAPAYSSVKRKGRSLECINKLRNIGSAVMLYAADQGGLPYAHHFNYWCDWGESLLPYMETGDFRNTWVPGEPWANGLLKKSGTFQHLAHEVGQGSKNKITGQVTWPGWSYFTCPEAPPSKALVPPWDGNWIHVYGHSYSCNEYLMPSNHSGNYVYGRLIPKVKPENLERPGSLILVCDAGASSSEQEASDTLFGPLSDGPNSIVWKFIVDGSAESANGYVSMPTPPLKDTDTGAGFGWPVYSRHRGICHALMADGHIEAFRNGEMKRRNFVSKGVTKNWFDPNYYVEAYYP